MNNLGDKNCVFAGRSAVISCSNTEPDASSTTRAHTELPFGEAAMNKVSTPLVAIEKLIPMSVRGGALVPSFATSNHRVWVPRWKPMQLLFSTEAARLVAATKDFRMAA